MSDIVYRCCLCGKFCEPIRFLDTEKKVSKCCTFKVRVAWINGEMKQNEDRKRIQL